MLAFRSSSSLLRRTSKFFKYPVKTELSPIKLQAPTGFFSTGIRTSEPVKFWDLLARRRRQASCSIIVQVHSPQSCQELYSYCNQFGKIVQMCHYTVSSDQMHFVIVEYENEMSVTNVLSNSHHVTNDDTVSVPVKSQFLWFRATGKQNRKKLQPAPVTSDIPLTNFGTKICTKEEINAMLAGAESISDQMILLQKMVSISETGSRIRYLACRQIELALNGMFSNCIAIPFGSSVNSFGKEGCDLDILVRLSTTKTADSSSRLAFHSKALLSSERSVTQRHMECLADILHLFLPGCVNVRRILQARVPIIKYNQEHTNLECDLSMANMTGVYMSDLLYTLANVDERVRPLVFTVRRWAQQLGLTNNSPGRWITNFSLTLMVIYFFQKINILPTVNLLMALAENDDKYITEDGINCTFLHDLTKLPATVPQKDSLHTLLLQFFEFYSKFDFTHQAISLNEGKEVHKPDTSALYIINPLERHFNVSKNVSVEELERLRIEFRNAAWILESQDSIKLTTQNWGLLDLFKAPNIQKPNLGKLMPSRLVEIKGLFEEESEGAKVIYKNPGLEKEIDKIKMETAEKIKSVNTGSKVRIRRR